MRARGDSGMVIFARTSAIALEGVDGLIRRLKTYEQAGADGLFILGIKTRAELDRVAQEVRLPMLLAGIGPELLQDPGYLASRGVRIGFSGHSPYTEAVKAFYQAVRAERERLGCAIPEQAPAGQLMDRLSRAQTYNEYVAEFLAPKTKP
jgi:carboxyvinyl-carboxyphosphonate phosphorylmutase